MEQAWTVDKYDIPRGDLEFWATRRGMLEPADSALVAESWRGAILMRRLAIVAALSYATGLALQACLTPLG